MRIALASATLVMLVLSWPLWSAADGADAFPRVPFLPPLGALPSLASHGMFFVLLGALAAAAVGIAWRKTLALALGLLLILITADQHRFQPWAYQFLVVGLLLVSLPPAQALRYTRWWFIALYAYSGLSKLDVSFCQELGNLFLTTALRPFGLDPAGWPPAQRVGAILAMPLGELAVAAALLAPGTRRLGLAAALALHAALIGILGPWGIGHSTIVLVWNAVMMVETAILFGPRETGAEPAATETGAGFLGLLARLVFWLGVLAPLGERWGWFDSWPSHALYASHAERTEILVLEDQANQLAPDLLHQLGPADLEGWRRLDLTGWSRAARGTPVYPQGRACNGLAEAIAARYRGRLLIKVVQWSRAGLWTGRRTRVEASGWEAIRRYGDRFTINAHPAESSSEVSSPPGGASNRSSTTL